MLRRTGSLAACLGSLGAARPASFDWPGPVLTIAGGRIRGLSDGQVRRFLGIPYGVIPGRFQPAHTAPGWTGIREAFVFGPAALQGQGGSLRRLAGTPSSPTSEQCLSVNVFTPQRADRLPVMVWVHGGANVSGASSQPVYDGSRFARSGVVCVTFNYRLGVFGFLELGGTYSGSGNNALRDQILLLHWVRENIAAFGGDPTRVTLAGESAGAKDVAALLASPAARGLFARVIMQSGGGRTVLSEQQAQSVMRRFMKLCSVSPQQSQRLIGLDARTLLEAQLALIRDGSFAYPLRPIVDGTVLPAIPELAVAGGVASHIPMLLGTNRDESHLFLSEKAANLPILGRQLSNLDPVGFERVLQRYDTSMLTQDASPTLADLRWHALTAEEYWIPSLRLAEAQSRSGGSVWMYRFDKAASSGRFAGRAAHASDLAYVWNNPNDPELAPLIAGFDATLAARIHAAWVAFIAGTEPAAPGLPTWPRYDAQSRATMIFDQRNIVQFDPGRSERLLWVTQGRSARSPDQTE